MTGPKRPDTAAPRPDTAATRATPVVRRAAVGVEPLDVAEHAALVDDPAAGAVVTFSGVVRDHDGGRPVRGLEDSGHPTAAPGWVTGPPRPALPWPPGSPTRSRPGPRVCGRSR